MKKITLFAALIAVVFSTKAQKVFDFTGSANPGSWVAAGSGTTATPSSDGMILEFNNGTPRLDISRAVDPFVISEGTHMVVTLINNSTEIGSFSCFYDKNGAGLSGTQFLGFQLDMAVSTGTGVETTYVYDLTNSNYANDPGDTTLNDTDNISNMEYIGIRFRDASGAALVGSSAVNGNIIIKKIQIVNSGSIYKAVYDFSTDNDSGFEGINGGTVTDGGTTLDFAGTGTATPKLVQSFYKVDASSNQYLHIVVDNNSSNADQIKFQFVDGATYTYGNQTLNSGTSTIIDVDLYGKTEWTGDIEEWRFVVTESGGAVVNTSLIEISKIIFDNNLTTLGIEEVNYKDDASIILYPTQARDVITINSQYNVERIEVYTVLGEKALSSNSKTINVSNLATGMYITKIYQEGNRVSTKRFVKQ